MTEHKRRQRWNWNDKMPRTIGGQRGSSTLDRNTSPRQIGAPFRRAYRSGDPEFVGAAVRRSRIRRCGYRLLWSSVMNSR